MSKTLNRFDNSFGVFIADFAKVNAGWTGVSVASLEHIQRNTQSTLS